MMLTGRGVGLACFASLFGNKLLGLLRFEVCLGVRLGGFGSFLRVQKKGTTPQSTAPARTHTI